ncbi:MAG: MarR family transcriptional regulator [Alphaproteobacteria bacterium]|nr:MarR family transcriptional regulator [Alphaproteobacteria bacterium]
MPHRARTAELIDRLSRITHTVQFAGDLNPAQWEALRFLGKANRYSMTPGALAEYMATTKGTASQTINALEAKGLVSRTRSATDRRSVHIALTAAGESLLRQDPLDVIEHAAGTLSATDQAALVAAIERLVDRLQGAIGKPTFGLCAKCAHFVPTAGREIACGGQCALTGDALGVGEVDRLCVDFEPKNAVEDAAA